MPLGATLGGRLTSGGKSVVVRRGLNPASFSVECDGKEIDTAGKANVQKRRHINILTTFLFVLFFFLVFQRDGYPVAPLVFYK